MTSVLSVRGLRALAMCAAGFVVCAGASAADAPALPYTLPARFDAGLIFVQPVTQEGVALDLFTDSGGGLFLSTAAADKLGIEFALPEDGKPRGPVAHAPWPALRKDAWIPQPVGVEDNGIAVMPPSPGLRHLRDGMLGAQWFANRCWEFDYPAKSLRLVPCGALPEVAAAHRVALGFQKDDAGEQTMAFPRITVEVDGEPLELLFDTGATITATEDALAKIDDGWPATRAGGFIVASVAARWRERHPEWTWIDQGERGTDLTLVRVGNVRVAGYDTGPAWFAVRPDPNFHEWMSQWMDRRIDGALGGSALQAFRITVDYPAEAATFERVE